MAIVERYSTIPRAFSGRSGVALLLAQGLLARLFVFDRVAVNGDTGLYIYDSQMILWGQQMFVDFPGRSPVVQYVLAGALWLSPFGNLTTTRGLMIIIGLLVGIAVYLLARELAGDRAGLAAMGLYLLTPFALTWGVWMKTELFAGLFGTLALYVAVRHLDDDEPPGWASATVGVLFGLTLLSRRVGFVLIGAVVLYTFWFRHHRRSFELRTTLQGGLVAAVAGVLTLFAMLAVMARGHPGLTWEFFDMYFLDLFRSGGFGAHGYLPLFGESYVDHQYANTGPQTMFQAVCQKCGQRTILVFIRVILASMVVLIPLLLWLKAYIERNPIEWFKWFVPAMLVTQAAFGFVLMVPSLLAWSEPEKALGLLVFGLAVALVWSVETPEWDDLTEPRVGLVILVPVLLAVGYLYRDRILYPTYWQDFYPTVAVLGGIALASAWRVMGPLKRPSMSARRVRQAGAIILVLAFYVSAVGAYPYIGPDPGPQYSNWYTTDRVEAYGVDLDERLEDDELVFAANPLYVVESEHRLVGHLSRRYYIFEGWPETAVADELAARVIRQLESDRVPVAMMSTELQTVLAANETVNETFHQEFCHVHDPLYETTDYKSLWVKKDHPRMPECGHYVNRPGYELDHR